MSALRIGLAGLGVVGASVAAQLQQPLPRLQGRFRLAAVCARDQKKQRGLDVSGAQWFADAVALASSPDIDVFVELIGGAEGPALAAVRAALQSGKSVVTANKAMLAAHGAELAALAMQQGAKLEFEGAVAGGAPVVRGLREGLAGAEIQSITAILNGTSNFILTAMRNERREFRDALAQAQQLGFAEADPALDVSGGDAAHKLAILCAIAFGGAPNPAGVRKAGLEQLSALDIAYAERLGCCIKPLAKAHRTAAGVAAWTGPALAPLNHPLAVVDGAENAVLVEAPPIGRLSFTGPGAGGPATAAAVLSDLAALAEGRSHAPFGRRSDHHALPLADDPRRVSRWYMRLWVTDRPGTLAAVSAELGLVGVSIDSLHQDPSPRSGPLAPIFLTTQPIDRSAIAAAEASLAALPVVAEQPLTLPIETALSAR